MNPLHSIDWLRLKPLTSYLQYNCCKEPLLQQVMWDVKSMTQVISIFYPLHSIDWLRLEPLTSYLQYNCCKEPLLQQVMWDVKSMTQVISIFTVINRALVQIQVTSNDIVFTKWLGDKGKKIDKHVQMYKGRGEAGFFT